LVKNVWQFFAVKDKRFLSNEGYFHPFSSFHQSNCPVLPTPGVQQIHPAPW